MAVKAYPEWKDSQALRVTAKNLTDFYAPIIDENTEVLINKLAKDEADYLLEIAARLEANGL